MPTLLYFIVVPNLATLHGNARSALPLRDDVGGNWSTGIQEYPGILDCLAQNTLGPMLNIARNNMYRITIR